MWVVTVIFFVRMICFIIYRLVSYRWRVSNDYKEPKCCKQERFNMFCNEFISIFLEGLLEFFVVSNLHLQAEDEFKGKTWSLVFVILYLISCLIVLPVLAIRVLCCKPLEELTKETTAKHYNSLYNHVKTKNRWTATYFFEQAVRRGLYAIIMFFVRTPTI